MTFTKPIFEMNESEAMEALKALNHEMLEMQVLKNTNKIDDYTYQERWVECKPILAKLNGRLKSLQGR